LGAITNDWAPTAAFAARFEAPEAFATVKVVPELIALTYHPAEAGIPGPEIGCPTATSAVLATVSTFPVVFAVTFIEPANPVAGANVNAVTFAVVFTLIRKAVALVTACTTDPAGIPVPEILCPTVIPAVLVTANVFCPEVFVTPEETDDDAPGVNPEFDNTHVPKPTF
jgi:hypothetical protein